VDGRALVEQQRVGRAVDAALDAAAHLQRLRRQQGAALDGAVDDDDRARGHQVAGDRAVDLDVLGADNQVVVDDFIGGDDDALAAADVGGVDGWGDQAGNDQQPQDQEYDFASHDGPPGE